MPFATIHEARIKLSQLLKKVSAGEEVIIVCGDKPVARLSPNESGNQVRSKASCVGPENSLKHFHPMN